MAPIFLPAIDLASGVPDKPGAGFRELSHVKTIFSRISPDRVEATITNLQKHLGVFEAHLDVTQLESLDDVVALLDAGAARVFASPKQTEHLAQVDNIDASRIVYTVGLGTDDDLEYAFADTRTAIYCSKAPEVGLLKQALSKRKHEDGPVFVNMDDSVEGAKTALDFAKAGAVPLVLTSYLTFDHNMVPDVLEAVDFVMARAVSDRPDGLFTTLVTDERNEALGVVFSSKHSVSESLLTGRGVYQSRKRGLWYKGATSGDYQDLVSIDYDCDQDCLRFVVRQRGKGFCHLGTATCFGDYRGLSKLQKTLQQRKASAPVGSYTARLFNDSGLLNAKIKEEAAELCEATDKDHIASEAADLLYFAMTKCVAAGVSLEDVERKLDAKSTKVKRRKGDAKPQYTNSAAPSATTASAATTTTNGGEPSRNGISVNDTATRNGDQQPRNGGSVADTELTREAASVPRQPDDPAGLDTEGRIRMTRYDTSRVPASTITSALQRPSQRSTEKIMAIVKPIISDVRDDGDSALLSYTHKFEKATSLTSPVLRAPFPDHLMQLPAKTAAAIDTAYANIRTFHAAQAETAPLTVETMPGVRCSRFSRPIERVGLYVPGGTAVLPSTALMLGVPALVAGCSTIVLASPPRADGSLTPEIVYIAHKIGASSIVLAGGAQAIAALAYGTESVPKVDKILGPGNQFVTAAKMLVSNDTTANVAIDMPAGPSEVLVIADETANPAFVAADLLSQAEHGTDSQVVLIAVALSEQQLDAIDNELATQAAALPRVDVVRGAIQHSVTLSVSTLAQALDLSNHYAPEHLILLVSSPRSLVPSIKHAGSVFIGPWAPESVGDYAAGVNHALPTYGYARQYSGVNLGSFCKSITSSEVTREGLRNLGASVMELARVEELEAHQRAVVVRLEAMEREEADGKGKEAEG